MNHVHLTIIGLIVFVIALTLIFSGLFIAGTVILLGSVTINIYALSRSEDGGDQDQGEGL